MECKDPSIIYQDGRYLMYYICQKLVEPVDEPMKQTHTGINVATSTDLHVHGIVPTTRTQLKHGIHRARCGLDNACAVVFCLIAVIIRSGEQVEPVGQIPIQTWAWLIVPLDVLLRGCVKCRRPPGLYLTTLSQTCASATDQSYARTLQSGTRCRHAVSI